MKIRLAFLTVAYFSSLAQAATLSLKDAIRFAAESSPTYDSAKKTESIRELEYKTSRARLLPSLDFSTTDGLQNNIPIASGGNTSLLANNPSSPWYSSLSLGVTENFYDNGVSWTGLAVAELNRELASLHTLKERDNLTLDVASEFYRYSLATALLEVRKEQQGVLEKQFRMLSSQYQQGFKTKSDFLRLKIQVQRAEIERITAENSILLSAAQLRKLLGVRYQDPSPPTFEAVPVLRERKMDQTLPDSPPTFEKVYDFKISRLQEQVNDKAVTLAKRAYWPQVLVTAGATYSNQNFINSGAPFSDGNQLSYNALLTLKFNLWDWGSQKRDIQIAEYNRDIQGNTLNQNLLTVQASITSLMADILKITHAYKLSRELLSLEEENNRNLVAQYREGKVAYLDLITGLNGLQEAKVQFYTSYFEALRILAQYRFYEGKIYETLLEN